MQFSWIKIYFLSNFGKPFIDHPLILSLLRENSCGISPFANRWNEDQHRPSNASLKDRVWPHVPCDRVLFSCGGKLLKVFCRAKFSMFLSEKSFLSLSVTQIISLHIKLQETVPAGSINVFITQPYTFPAGRKLGKHAPSLLVTFKDENKTVIVAVFISKCCLNSECNGGMSIP